MSERLDSAFEIAQDAIDRGNQYLDEKEKLLLEITKLKRQRRKMQKFAAEGKRSARIINAVHVLSRKTGVFKRMEIGGLNQCQHCYRVAHEGECRR